MPKMLLGSDTSTKTRMRLTRPSFAASVMASKSSSKDISKDSSVGILDGKASKGLGTTARGRRLLKVREEKRKREYDRLHNYPAWATVLEDVCKNDTELRAVLGDSIGNPKLMRQRLANSSMEHDPLYDADKVFKVILSSFHDISDIEFQDNWGRI